MKNSFVLLVGFAIVAVLLSHMFLYQVRYDQVAVRTTFDKADETSVQDTPGLKWRWPWPINKVTLYPKRLQLLEDKIEELQTSDGKSVIVRTYLTWRIADPLKFYITLKDPSEAARQLSSRLREVRPRSAGRGPARLRGAERRGAPAAPRRRVERGARRSAPRSAAGSPRRPAPVRWPAAEREA